MVVLRDCPSEGAEFEAVLALLRVSKGTVGFLPDDALRDRALRGTLLIACHKHDVAGYVLFDLPRGEIRIRQLVVGDSWRGVGIARSLIEEVAIRHPSLRGMVLECRRDFAASAAWPRLGFTPIAERPGRSAERKPLTVWWRDFEHPNLFTLAADEDKRPIAALDANIVIDLADGADTPSAALADDWIDGAVRIAVTDEVVVEIDRHDDPIVREAHKRAAGDYSRLAGPPGAWKAMDAEITTRLGDGAAPYSKDIRHVAKAAAGGARWFITRDDRFRLACASATKELADVEVVSPSAFVVALDQYLREDEYRPVDLEATDVEARALDPAELDLAARVFVNQKAGEKLSSFRAQLNGLVAKPHTTRAHVLASAGELLALTVTEPSPTCLEVPVCRVRNGPAQPTLARQQLGWLRTLALAQGLAGIHVTDPHPGEWVEKSFAAEGFQGAPQGYTALAIRGRGSLNDLRTRLNGVLRSLEPSAAPPNVLDAVERSSMTAETAFELEAAFHPFVLEASGLPTFLVPIRAAWATALFDEGLSRGQLFRRERALALRREHVYYRSPTSSGGLRAPGRILWYVSGTGSGSKTIRALSALSEVAIGPAAQLHNRFAHLGVYSRSDVEAAAVDGLVMALRFTRTRLFSSPVGLEQYRSLVDSHVPGRGVALARPQPVPEQVFAQIDILAS